MDLALNEKWAAIKRVKTHDSQDWCMPKPVSRV